MHNFSEIKKAARMSSLQFDRLNLITNQNTLGSTISFRSGYFNPV